jgi:hypothetical protein
VLIGELCCRSEMAACHGEHGKAFDNQLIEHRERGSTLFQADLTGPQSDRHSR